MQRFSAASESKWNLALLCLPKHPRFDNEVENVKHINYLSVESTVPGAKFQQYIGQYRED